MKYYKLKKQTDFQKLFQKGKKIYSNSLTVVYRPSERITMGISVGKRHGKSVQRNRIKRLLRESFKKCLPNIKGNYTFVLIPKVAEYYSLDIFEKHLQCMIKKENL